MKTNARILTLTALLIALLTLSGPALADTLTLPAGLKTIEAEAFMGNTSLDEVVLPEGIESIGEKAFADSSLTRINLPSSLKSLPNNVFSNVSLSQVEAGWKTNGAKWAISHAVKLVTPEKYGTSFSPITTIQSAGNSQSENGTDITSYLGKCFTVQDVVGGWFKFTAPSSGSYTFSVRAASISEAFYLRVYAKRDGSQVQLKRCLFEESADIVTYTVTGIQEGENIYWWDGKTSNTGNTFLDPFQIMVAPASKISSTSPEPVWDPVILPWTPEIQNVSSADGDQLTIAFNSIPGATSYTIKFKEVSTGIITDVSVSADNCTGDDVLSTQVRIDSILNDQTEYSITIQALADDEYITYESEAVTYTTDFPVEFTLDYSLFTIILQGQTSGTFDLFSNMETGDTITFTVTSNRDWTVFANNTAWLDVTKSGNDAIVTITDVEAGYNYVSELIFNAGGKEFTLLLNLEKPAAEALSIITNPSSQTVSDGETVTLSVAATGGSGSYTYQWYRASSATATGSKVSTSQNYSFTADVDYDGYYYYCVVSSGNDSLPSERAILTVEADVPDPITELDTPTLKSVKATGENSITVTWNSVSNASGYYVYRSTTNETNYSLVGDVDSGTTFTDDSLSPGTRYYYKVQAYTILQEIIVSSISSSRNTTTDTPVIDEITFTIYHGTDDQLANGTASDVLAAGRKEMHNAISATSDTIQTWTISSSESWSVSTSGDTSWFYLEEPSTTQGNNKKLIIHITSWTPTYHEAVLTFIVGDNGNTYRVVIWQGDEAYKNGTLTLSMNNWEIDYLSNSTSVTVNGGHNYSVTSSDETWLTAEKNSSTKATISVRTNYGLQTRSGTVTFTCTTDGTEYIMRVTQGAGAPAPTVTMKLGSEAYGNGREYGPLALGDIIYMTTEFTNAKRIYIRLLGPNGKSVVEPCDLDLSSGQTSLDWWPTIPSSGAYGLYTMEATVSNSDMRDDSWAQKQTDLFYINVPDPSSHMFTVVAGLKQIDYKPGEYFTKSHDKECYHNNDGNHVCFSIKGSDELGHSAWQCLGFAYYAQKMMYSGSGKTQTRQSVGIKPKTLVSKNADLQVQDATTQERIKNLIIDAGPGCHVRVYHCTGYDGKVSETKSYWGHSFIVRSVDQNGMSIIDCNSDGVCGIRTTTWTWDYFFNNTSYGKRGLHWIELYK